MKFLHRFILSLGCAFLLGASGIAHAADPLKIGFLTTLSGPGAVLGQDFRDGFNLAVKHSGGTLGGVPVEVLVVDDEEKAASARQTIDRFIKRDKVDIVTGIVFSSVLLPVLPAILNSDTIYLSLNSGPADYAGEKCNPNFFAVAWQNEDIPQAIGRFASSQNYKRVALIAPNYPGGRESLGGFKREYKGEVSAEIYTKLGQTDFAAELATLRAANPDAIYFFLPGGMGINFIKQYQASGMGKQVPLLANGFSADEDVIKAVGEPMVGMYNASQWAADLNNPANKRFVEDFAKTYGRKATINASQAYDTALLIDAAVRAVGGAKVKDHAALRKALRTVKFDSVRGAFKFNNNQYPIHTLYIRKVEKDAQGVITNRLLKPIIEEHRDPFAPLCKMG